jgi:hypothetical protein
LPSTKSTNVDIDLRPWLVGLRSDIEMLVNGPFHGLSFRLWPIVLQNSKVAAVQIFGENLERKEIDDSHSFSRATEVAHEFGGRR